ncbi:MAG: outer membrane protein transport protein [Bacteroidota bacterium]
MRLYSQHLLGTIVLSALVVCIALGGGFQLNEVGARAMAQGGAFAARASDPSAMYFNPAGLGFQGSSIYLGTTFIMPKVTFYGPSNLSLNDETKMVDQTFTPINIYGTFELNDNIHIGLGVTNPYGLGTEWPANWAGQYITQKIDLTSFFITPTVAYKVNDQLSVGAGLNYVTGKVTMKIGVPIPFDTTHPIVNLDLSATGLGFNVGIIYKLMPELSLGISYRSSVKLDASGTAKFDPNYTLLGLPNGDATATITLPATGFVGVAYKAMENLEVEADYQYVGWSSYKELAIGFKADPTKNEVMTKNYQDTYILRFGAEYTMDDIQLRAGYLYDHSPVLTAYVDPMLPDANRNGYNIGVGYKINEQWRVDAAYFFLKFDQRKAENTVIAFDGTYNMTATLIGIDIGYTF